MKTPIIELHEISKKYTRGERQIYHSLRDSITGLFNRTPHKKNDDFWALRKISFKIYPGEIIGVIGRNGAGKSTLLKILSRITPPTGGKAVIRGRLASLLEVGTGFHPELTGRENIYLNGAILGMTRLEIKNKMSQIIDFSGIDKFIDTPVKRYSSGMYVRLAFAVAAHLDPEILVIDEVLSVGDAEFHRKSLGKMEKVARDEMRTILFVSHNLAAIRNLCSKTIWIDKGRMVAFGPTEKVISSYLEEVSDTIPEAGNRVRVKNRQGNQNVSITHIFFRNSKDQTVHEVISGHDLRLVFKFTAIKDVKKVKIGFNLSTESGQNLILNQNAYTDKLFDIKKGKGEIISDVEKLPLAAGTYLVGFRLEGGGVELDYPLDPVVKLNVIDGDFFGTGVIPNQHSPVLVHSRWLINQ